MTPETLEALKGSIEKWRRIEANEIKDEGTENCPLCQLFHEDYRKDDEISCQGCPVFEHTEKQFCRGTPYIVYDKTREAASAELEFLRSLLPTENCE